MKHKIKVEELIDMFKPFVSSEKDIIDDRTYNEIITSHAIQCALVMVKEILKHETRVEEYAYWNKIKSELYLYRRR